MKEKPLPYITEKTVNDWYHTASFRFESSIETEGMVLEQLKKPDFRRALLSKISEFKFTGEACISKPSIMSDISIGTTSLQNMTLLILQVHQEPANEIFLKFSNRS